MNISFYTSVVQYGNRMLVRGFEHGKRFSRKVDFTPTLFVDAKKTGESSWKTLDGKTVYPINPGTIRDCKEFIEQYKDVHGFGIYGMNQYEYQYIADNYHGTLSPDTSKIKIFTVDIETKTEYGFPNIQTANEEILLISVMDYASKAIVTFGCGDYTPSKPNVRYVKCSSESQLLNLFAQFWNKNYPDVVTGWNVNNFDIPYIIRRMRYLGINAEILSPWSMIRDSNAWVNEEKVAIFSIPGIAILDYMELYKKFTFTSRESYKLDHICEVELGENKLENPYDTFKEFYTKDFQRFSDYNVHDVYLVDKLEDRLKLITLAFTLAYKAKVNFEDVYSPVRTWDVLIYNYLRDKNVAIPFKRESKAVPFEGGYVKDPIAGLHKWVASFDLTSLYPHIIMQYAMSPENLVDRHSFNIDDFFDISDCGGVKNIEKRLKELESNVAKLKFANIKEEYDHLLRLRSTPTYQTLLSAHENNLSCCANGTLFYNKPGFLPELMSQLYKDRKVAKNEMLELEKQYELSNDPALEKEIARLDTLQLAIKVTLNSGYGAVTNAYFRYFDIRIGEGITITGQLASRWVARKLNEFMNKSLSTEGVDYVIYSDTDSCYLSLDKFIEKFGANRDTTGKIKLMEKFCIEVLQPQIDKFYQEMAEYTNAYEQMMKMKLEVIADVGIFYKKKKYLLNVHSSEGVTYAEPKLKIKGLSMVQSSTPEVCRDSLRKSIKVALTGDANAVKDFMNEFRDKFHTYSAEQIAKPTSVNNLAEYTNPNAIYAKGCPINVRAALLYNHHLKRLGLDKKYQAIKGGEKIKFVFLKMPNPFFENVIGFPGELPKEFGLDEYIDYDTQFEKTFKDALDDLVKPMGWNLDAGASLDDLLFG